MILLDKQIIGVIINGQSFNYFEPRYDTTKMYHRKYRALVNFKNAIYKDFNIHIHYSQVKMMCQSAPLECYALCIAEKYQRNGCATMLLAATEKYAFNLTADGGIDSPFVWMVCTNEKLKNLLIKRKYMIHHKYPYVKFGGGGGNGDNDDDERGRGVERGGCCGPNQTVYMMSIFNPTIINNVRLN